MATGIMIMGSSGSGKTTLGNLVANELGYTFVDIDEYIWRKDTEIPFTSILTLILNWSYIFIQMHKFV